MSSNQDQINEIRELEIPWCGSSSCRFGVPKTAGMMTNGNCYCFPERSLTDDQRTMVKLIKAVPVLLAKISVLEEENSKLKDECLDLLKAYQGDR